MAYRITSRLWRIGGTSNAHKSFDGPKKKTIGSHIDRFPFHATRSWLRRYSNGATRIVDKTAHIKINFSFVSLFEKQKPWRSDRTDLQFDTMYIFWYGYYFFFSFHVCLILSVFPIDYCIYADRFLIAPPHATCIIARFSSALFTGTSVSSRRCTQFTASFVYTYSSCVICFDRNAPHLSEKTKKKKSRNNNKYVSRSCALHIRFVTVYQNTHSQLTIFFLLSFIGSKDNFFIPLLQYINFYCGHARLYHTTKFLADEGYPPPTHVNGLQKERVDGQTAAVLSCNAVWCGRAHWIRRSIIGWQWLVEFQSY